MFLMVFFTQIRKKYGIFVIPTKNKVICDTESIYMLILADEACHFSTIGLNKNNNKKRTSRSFSILFSVLESSEIAISPIFHFFSAVSINI